MYSPQSMLRKTYFLHSMINFYVLKSFYFIIKISYFLLKSQLRNLSYNYNYSLNHKLFFATFY